MFQEAVGLDLLQNWENREARFRCGKLSPKTIWMLWSVEKSFCSVCELARTVEEGLVL